MNTKALAAAACLLAGILLSHSPWAAQDEPRGAPADAPGPMAQMGVLEGTWVANGDGFSSTLVYEWALPNVLLRVRNELRDAAGTVFGQYVGHYAWDADQGTLVFWTVGRGGELHRGTAAWRDGRLWHQAAVTGGRITGYRSVLVPAGGELRFQSRFDPAASDGDVLASAPLVYRPR